MVGRTQKIGAWRRKACDRGTGRAQHLFDLRESLEFFKRSNTELRLKSQFRLARWVRQINSKVVVTVSGEREGEEGDATLWSHRPLSVLPEVYRLRASVRLGHL